MSCNAGDNAENLARKGPVPAEGKFTIINLLTTIGLTDLARYYSDPSRRHPLAAKNDDGTSSKQWVWVWEYETDRANLSDACGVQTLAFRPKDVGVVANG